MVIQIEKKENYGEANVTVIGITRHYGKPQFILVDSDEGRNHQLKFPGLRFRAPPTENQTLEDCAKARFEEQTGLSVKEMLGLRAIVPTRSRHGGKWIFRNVFLAEADAETINQNDGRFVYLANPGQGIYPGEEFVFRLGSSKEKRRLEWIVEDNRIIAEIAQNLLHYFDWNKGDSTYLRKITCLGAQPQTLSEERPLGYGLAVASMMLLYKPSANETEKIILLKRKEDKYPGYAGGKIETPDVSRKNVGPISCCAKEGSEEYGFSIEPVSLIGVATTSCNMGSENHYNSIINYAFVARPTNPRLVKDALSNPGDYLEDKMECYVVEDLIEHRDRISRGELRMPDNFPIGGLFYDNTPAERISLEQIIPSGID